MQEESNSTRSTEIGVDSTKLRHFTLRIAYTLKILV